MIFAIGQRPHLPEGFDVDRTDRGLIALDEFTQGTSREGVFAAGDAVSGSASVIKAIAAGRRAAVAMDKFLGGNGRIDRKPAPQVEPPARLGSGEGFAALGRVADACVIPDERLTGFCEVVRGHGQRIRPARKRVRCLQCDLRLKMTTVKFWGSY